MKQRILRAIEKKIKFHIVSAPIFVCLLRYKGFIIVIMDENQMKLTLIDNW